MIGAVSIPVSVKCRIGVDHREAIEEPLNPLDDESEDLARGGGLCVLERQTNATLIATSVERCNASSANGTAEGGALYADDSLVTLKRRTQRRLNVASDESTSTLQLVVEDLGVLLPEVDVVP